MTIDLAKIICKAHVENVLQNIPNSYTPEEIGEAIDVIKDKMYNYSIAKYAILSMYQLWRRGYLEYYPQNTVYNMKILKESITLI